jgi:hypothetical protein
MADNSVAKICSIIKQMNIHLLNMFESKVPRRKSEPKGEEITGR